MVVEMINVLQGLQSSLDRLCPVLKPVVTPRGFQCTEKQLLKLCRSQSQRSAFEKALEQIPREVCGTCGATGCEMKLSVVACVKLAAKAFNVEKLEFVCGDCHCLRSADKFFELQLNDSDDQGLVNHLAEHMLKVNNHDPTEVLLLQEMYTVAFSLKVLLRALPPLNLTLGGAPTPLPSTEDGSVFAKLLGVRKAKLPKDTPKKREAGPEPHLSSKRSKKKKGASS